MKKKVFIGYPFDMAPGDHTREPDGDQANAME